METSNVKLKDYKNHWFWGTVYKNRGTYIQVLFASW